MERHFLSPDLDATDGQFTLREARAERLLSIRALAQAASVAPSTIYLIEAGRTIPRASVIRRVADALAVPPRQIYEFRKAIEMLKVPNRSGRSERPSTGPLASTAEATSAAAEPQPGRNFRSTPDRRPSRRL
ncbi:MAG: helix-turn-helix domain-containing protein [Chloroflexota bacterium]|nr:helix-turn-helix domain-containing protein [Chloroflexota bacterium]